MDRDERIREVAQEMNDLLFGADTEIAAAALCKVLAAFIATHWEPQHSSAVMDHYFAEAKRYVEECRHRELN